jgi:integrase
MKNDFNPAEYLGKKTIYRPVPRATGIRQVWDWCEKTQRYRQREFGNRYEAFKRVQLGVRRMQKSQCFETFQEAKRWRDAGDLAVALTRDDRMTFKELIAQFFEHKKGQVRQTTIETYENQSRHLRYFESYYVEQIDDRLIDTWLVAMKRPDYLANQHKTRLAYDKELTLLRQVLAHYIEYVDGEYRLPIRKKHHRDQIVDIVRYKAARAQRRTRFIPRDECEKFLGQLRSDANREPGLAVYYYLAHFQLRTGVRIAEACALSWKDIDLSARAIEIGKTVHWSRRKGVETRISPLTKTGEHRTIPLLDQLHDALIELSQATARSTGLVFSEDGFRPLGYRSIQYRYDSAFRRSGVEFRSTHILRHSFATDFLEHTENQHALKEILGHASLKQTEHYGKVTKALRERGLAAYAQSLPTPAPVIAIRNALLRNAGK